MAACEDILCAEPTVAGAGTSPVAVRRTGRLPYTGIEDILLPMFLGAIALLAGVLAFRGAKGHELLTRKRISQRMRRRITGYSNALDNMEANRQAARFWGSGGPGTPAAA